MRDAMPTVRSPSRVDEVCRTIGSGVSLCRFECPPDAQAWSGESRTGEAYLAVFPTLPVAIRHAGRGEVIADRTKVMLYNPGQVYRRRRITSQGDACSVLVIGRTLADEIAGDISAEHTDHEARLFDRDHAPCPTALFAAHRGLVSSGMLGDDLALDESLVGFAHALLRHTLGEGHRRSEDTLRRAHLDLAHAACEILAREVGIDLCLNDLADALDVSPFHLCRVFARATGTTIARHRNALRVRAGADLLRDERLTIARVATELGFSSHAHFTSAFRGVIGMTPSAYRSYLGVRARS